MKDDVCMNPGRGKLEDVANTLGIDCSSMTDEELKESNRYRN